MTNKTYPLDITVACSIGLEGGLLRYKNDLPYFSRDDFELVHEWNRNLKKTMKEPEFKEYMTTTYRILLHLPAVTLSKIIDGLSVPYRSYYYAKRFLDAANFVYGRSEQNTNVVDFGRGLSPWGHVIKQHRPDIQMYTFDKDETNSVFKAVSNKMNFAIPYFNKMPSEPVFDRDIFVSLGTFVYLNTAEQIKKLNQASAQFKNLFIELEKTNIIQRDKSVVNNLGTEYYSGFSKQELNKILGNRVPFELKEINGYIKDTNIVKSLKFATEQFLVR